MNIIQILYDNMKEYNNELVKHISKKNYVKEFRTISYNPGRQSGKTQNICEFVVKNKFDGNVMIVVPDIRHITLFKERINIYKKLYPCSDNNISYHVYRTFDDSMRGVHCDVLIYDNYSYCLKYLKNECVENEYLCLNEKGVVFRVG